MAFEVLQSCAGSHENAIMWCSCVSTRVLASESSSDDLEVLRQVKL